MSGAKQLEGDWQYVSEKVTITVMSLLYISLATGIRPTEVDGQEYRWGRLDGGRHDTQGQDDGEYVEERLRGRIQSCEIPLQSEGESRGEQSSGGGVFVFHGGWDHQHEERR